jgi:leucyl-tRNA---protein transferase
MKSLFEFTTPPHSCSYLPEQTARMHYEIVGQMSALEYRTRLEAGWRRFGASLFGPNCPHCLACQSLRVDVKRFQPNRSQRRAWKANADVELRIAEPSVSDEKLDLYDRFHFFQSGNKGWPEHAPKEKGDYIESFVQNPVPTLEMNYFLGDRLLGVGYADRLPGALSAIYFFYDPEMRERSLGTFNVLRILELARHLNVPYVYLGYFVAGCQSLEYKANFTPNQVLGPDGSWLDFRS